MAEEDAIVTPGDVVASDTGFVRGHGVYASGTSSLLSSVCGRVVAVNAVIAVEALRHRYAASVGDTVVGRVVSLGAARWRVHVAAHTHAQLTLAGVQLSGGEQRRRTITDAHSMREVYAEDDLVAAEVHSVSTDGTIHLHARSHRHTRLENGCLVTVPPALMRRLKSHFVTLPCGVHAVLGMNGSIWLTVGGEKDAADAADTGAAPEALPAAGKSPAPRPLTREDRERVARVHNSIGILRARGACITPESIMRVYESTKADAPRAADMLALATRRRPA